MTMIRRILPTWVPQLYIVIILAVIIVLSDLSVVVVEAFASIPTATPLVHSSIRHPACHQRVKTSTMRLWAHRRQVNIREWRSSGKESQNIFNFLLRREQEQHRTSANVFDPEGSLELDVLNPSALQESYSKDDGSCFLVAVTGDDDENDDGENIEVVGTLGMIAGTQVSYQSSGSSVSKPEITAAIRRVCASWLGDDKDDTANYALTKKTSTTTILEELIRQGEQRAIQSGATDLIGLAYPETAVVDDDDYEKSKDIVKPTGRIFESLGYTVSDQQIPGVATIQYEKKLSQKQLSLETIETNTNAVTDTGATTTTTAQGGLWIIPATIAASLSLVLLVFNLYSNIFGIEQLWGSSDNGGIGTSLSTQNLEELIRNEQLGRSGLDDDIAITTTRQWEDLSPEELREEQALMKVIQGQTIRSK